MRKKTVIAKLEENTKYFDLCYWKERRRNPNSLDLKNWTDKKRKNFQGRWFGGKNGC